MTEDELGRLKRELLQLKTDFTQRTTALEKKIERYETGQHRDAPIAPLDLSDLPKPGPTPRPQKPAAAPKPIPTKEFHTLPDKSVPAAQDDFAARPETSSHRKETAQALTEGLLENVLPIFGPALVLFGKLLSVYRHYKSQGKAPVFFMTLAGILTLVMGVGYLMQYSFSQFLGPLGKVGIGFSASAAVTVCGIGVSRKRPDMSDYASSLIGLGTILSYLCAYFTGPYYGFLSDIGTFVLLAFLTAISYALAMAFKTRIVAVVSLCGGILAPLFMAGAMSSHVMYLSYILTLTIAMLSLSRRIDWPQLGFISTAASYLVIEFVIYSLPAAETASVQMVVLLHLFFYIFYIHNGSQLLKNPVVTRVTAILASSNIIFFLFTLNQIAPEGGQLGILYLLNALILAGVFHMAPLIVNRTGGSRDNRRSLQMVSLMCCGLLAGFGILALAEPEFLGLIWGVESLVLLAFGTRFDLKTVRVESYVVLTLSFVAAGFHVLTWTISSLMPLPQIIALEFGYGWMNLMVLWGLPAAFILMMEQSETPFLPSEALWLYGWNEVVSLCISLAFLLTAGLFGSHLIWLLGIVPMFYLVFRSSRKKLPYTEYVALAHIFLLAVPMLTSALSVGSFYFNEQVMLGKIARIEAFLCLYAIAEFYRRLHVQSRLTPMTRVLRQVFFCAIPVIFLPAVLRQNAHAFPLAVWSSAVICLTLFRFLKYKSLEVEFKLLVLGAASISIISCALIEFSAWQGYGIQALLTGLIFLGILLFGLKGLEEAPTGSDAFLSFREKVSFTFPLFFYYAGICLFTLSYAVTGSAALAFTVMTASFFILCLKQPSLPPLENNAPLLYLIAGSSAAIWILIHLLFFSTGHHPTAGICAGIVLALFGLLVHPGYPHLEYARKALGGAVTQFWIFHVLACLTYIGLLRHWVTTAFGPALTVVLVCHATLVLFLTLISGYQKLISIAGILFAISAGKILIFDMHDFSLIQKMIAFIVIGVLLLAGAYQYQRLKARGTEEALPDKDLGH